jgi:hypothetical protein
VYFDCPVLKLELRNINEKIPEFVDQWFIGVKVPTLLAHVAHPLLLRPSFIDFRDTGG